MIWFMMGTPVWLIGLIYAVGLLMGAVMLYDVGITSAGAFPGGHEGKLVWVVLSVFAIGFGLQPFVPVVYWFAVFRKRDMPAEME